MLINDTNFLLSRFIATSFHISASFTSTPACLYNNGSNVFPSARIQLHYQRAEKERKVGFPLACVDTCSVVFITSSVDKYNDSLCPVHLTEGNDQRWFGWILEDLARITFWKPIGNLYTTGRFAIGVFSPRRDMHITRQHSWHLCGVFLLSRIQPREGHTFWTG
ncbi:hypothetical protein K469DRAFT_373244 [Zopfia rhizophila CBS 207.26]|uniref:Uncharacterized protein n=1 Tax=Zopfia rhizophila CBS 207.26 TaxID=1314779 RepID=A0A6A6EK58_9PEZI|nr:hypothetical protein K469DRAFT_373244 [Zopfia rhizophila CBS 207.26]